MTARRPSRPTLCPECRTAFHTDKLLQAEARHRAVQDGPAAARALVDERLQEHHDSGHQ